MNFAIIGTGMIAHFHAKAIQAMNGGNLYAIYGTKQEKVNKFSTEYGCKGFNSLDKLLADSNVDIVTIATPSGTHAELSIQALKAKKNVACEKPIDITLDKIDEAIQIANENGVILAGILNRRFHPVMDLAKKACEKQRLGKLTMCDAYIKWYRDEQYYQSASWRGTWQLDGGGALMNQSIHTIDQLIYLAGDIKYVQASVTNILHKNIEVEDTAIAMIEFTSGAYGVIQGSTACWSSTGHPAEVQLCGLEGSLFISDEHLKVWDFKNDTLEDEKIRKQYINSSTSGLGANDPSAINFSGHTKNFEHIVDSIKNGTPLTVSAQEARKAVAVICAIYESAQNQGKKIKVN